MNIKLPSKLNSQFHKLPIWKRIFIFNYYDNKEKFIPKDNREYSIEDDINEELYKLYSLAESEDNFRIDYIDNEYLEKEYENELNAIIERGNPVYIQQTKKNKQVLISKLAEKYTTFLYEEYKHIVDVLKNSNYDNSFKYLILNETLTKIYRKEKGHILNEKRILNKSINDHMILGYDILDYIYQNISHCESFVKLYFEAIEYTNKKSLSSKSIQIDNLDTFNKGRWIKFKGKDNCTPEEFQENVSELKALVANTNWCTKNNASSHLSGGDFYVFVDNEDNPHIAVKTIKDSIDEVRGILKGQRIEPEYENVVYEFLTKNKDIRNGENWLNNQQWNEDIKTLINLLENDIVLDKKHLNKMNEVFSYTEYRSHGGENIHLQKLYDLASTKEYIREYFKDNETIVDKMNIVAKYKTIEKELESVSDYKELLKLTMEIITGFCNGKYGKYHEYRDELFEKLKDERLVKIFAKYVENENNGHLMESKDINYWPVRAIVNVAYLYKKLDTVNTWEELKWIVYNLYEIDIGNEGAIEYSPLKELIIEKLKDERIIKLMADIAKIGNNGQILNIEDNKNKDLVQIINSAFIYKHIDEINSIKEIEDTIIYLFGVTNGVVFNGQNINNLYLKNEINQKLNDSIRIKKIIAREYGCSLEDVVYVNGSLIDCDIDNYENKYIYGMVNFYNNKNKHNFKAKCIIGIVRKTYSSYNYCIDELNLENLEYCSYMNLTDYRVINASKLKECKVLGLSNANKARFPALIKCDSINLSNCKYIDIPSLENARKLNIRSCKNVMLNNLQNIEEIRINDCGLIELRNLKNAGIIGLSKNHKILVPLVEDATAIGIKNCEYVNLVSLKNVERFVSVERSNVVESVNLVSVGENIDLIGTKGVDLSNLCKLGGHLKIVHCEMEGLPGNEEIKSKIITSKKGR